MSEEAPQKKKPPIGRPFQKGQSGNPGGRPKTRTLREYLGETDETGEISRRDNVHLALYLLAIKSGRDQLAAIELLKLYDEGRPKTSLEVTGKDGAPVAEGGTLSLIGPLDNMTTGGLRKQLEELRKLRDAMVGEPLEPVPGEPEPGPTSDEGR